MITEREHLEALADRCELEMIAHAERSLGAAVGPVRTNARTAAAEMAMVAGTLRDRIARLYPEQMIISGEPAPAIDPEWWANVNRNVDLIAQAAQELRPSKPNVVINKPDPESPVIAAAQAGGPPRPRPGKAKS